MAHILLNAMVTQKNVSWDVTRVAACVGAEVSLETCQRALKHLEDTGAIVECEPGIWRRRDLWPGTQAEWYT